MVRTRRVAMAMAALMLTGLVTVGAAQPAVAEDANCRTTPGSSPTYPGPSASQTYDHTFNNSVAIPAGLISGRYVPQGLAY